MIEDRVFDDPEFLATEIRPPGRLARCINYIYFRMHGVSLEASPIYNLDRGLRKHRAEVLARPDTLPEVRRYIKRYIPE